MFIVLEPSVRFCALCPMGTNAHLDGRATWVLDLGNCKSDGSSAPPYRVPSAASASGEKNRVGSGLLILTPPFSVESPINE